MDGPGTDSGMRRRTAATPVLNDCIPRRLRHDPRLRPWGSETLEVRST